MAYSGLASFVKELGTRGELVRIGEFVGPELEITEITDRISKLPLGGKALLFENNGTTFPLLINAFGSPSRMALALGRENVGSLQDEMDALFKGLTSPKETFWDKLRMIPMLKQMAAWMPRKVKGRGSCQAVVMDVPDLSKLPVLKCWPADGGPFITLPAVHTRDPETGAANTGMYRMQVLDNTTTGMHWHRHKTGAAHFEKYKKSGKLMPVTVTLGGDPAYIYAATAPMPENLDEYLLAGFLRKKQVRMVKCLTNDLYVPDDVDFVIEGFVDPMEPFVLEGPFGDHTGFYSLADYYPRFHVTSITHRKDAVYPATIVGIPPMEDAWIGQATEQIFFAPIRFAIVPELLDMHLPFAGVAHNLAIVKIRKSYPGQAVKTMNSLWGAGQMMFNKFMVVVDEDVDIHDHVNFVRKAFDRFSPSEGTLISKGPLDVLDHSSSTFAYGSKMGIDLTFPIGDEPDDGRGNAFVAPAGVEPPVFENAAIIGVHDLFETLSIPVLLLGIRKTGDFRFHELASEIEKVSGCCKYKLIVLMDEGVDFGNHFGLVWLVSGNVDPQRDTREIAPAGRQVMVVDATMKESGRDGFSRDWPNIVVSSDETIATIDQKWEHLGIGPFVPSPSLRFKGLVPNSGAVRGPRSFNGK